MNVRKTCTETENTLTVRLSLLYATSREEHKDIVKEIKNDFLQDSGAKNLFETVQQKYNNLKRDRGFLVDVPGKMTKREQRCVIFLKIVLFLLFL